MPVTSLIRPVPLTAAILAIAAVFFSAAATRAHKTVMSPFTYYQDVRPIFERQCVRCHQADAPASPLRFANAIASTGRFETALLAHAASHSRELTTIEFDTVMTWAAGGAPEGTPPAGTPATLRARPHAIHAGTHGGLMGTIRGDTLHVEGVWSEQRRFRVYVTDVAGEPLPLARLQQLAGQVSDPAGAASPLAAAAGGEYLEARIGTVTAPAQFSVVIKGSQRGDDVIGMNFPSYSVPPQDLLIPATRVPSTAAEIAASILEQHTAVKELIRGGQYGQLYLPTTHVRNLVLALSSSPETSRSVSRVAVVRQLMVATWLLHLDGDNNGPFEVRRAATRFDDAVVAVLAAFR